VFTPGLTFLCSVKERRKEEGRGEKGKNRKIKGQEERKLSNEMWKKCCF